jgi:protein-S-isoprenylcysteine O-methyltransferase Ste14
MRLIASIAGTLAFFVVAPGTIALWLPWRITRGRVQALPAALAPVRPLGVVLAGVGALGLAACFARFVVQGLGTPAPVMPPQRLVITGLYRYVRNPMYVAILWMLTGEALALGSLDLVLYASGVWLMFHLWVLGYEEPSLRAKFGADYAAYCAGVRRWWPRTRPWSPHP